MSSPEFSVHLPNALLRRLAGLPFGVYMLAGFLLMCCGICGALMFMKSAGANFHEVTVLEQAAPINDVAGFGVDGAGNLYVGGMQGASVQAFDKEGRFLYRLGIPVYGGGFCMSVEEDGTLHVLTYRGDTHYAIQDQQVLKEEYLPEYEDFEDVRQRFDCRDHNSRAERAGVSYRVFVGGNVSMRGGARERLSLQAPHWPLPVSANWLMTGVGWFGGIGLIFLSLQVESYRRANPARKKPSQISR